MKNVIALGEGIIVGVGLGENAQGVADHARASPR